MSNCVNPDQTQKSATTLFVQVGLSQYLGLLFFDLNYFACRQKHVFLRYPSTKGYLISQMTANVNRLYIYSIAFVWSEKCLNTQLQDTGHFSLYDYQTNKILSICKVACLYIF